MTDILEVKSTASEIESLTRELSLRYEELSAIYRLSAQLKEHPTPQSLLHLIMEQVQSLMGPRYLSLIVIGQETLTSVDSKVYPLDKTLPSMDSKVYPLDDNSWEVKGKEDLPAELVRLWEEARGMATSEKEGVIINGAHPGEHSILVMPFYANCILGFLQLADKQSGEEWTAGDKKLISAVARVGAVALENINLYNQLQELFLSTVSSLSAAIDAKDPYTKGHSARVSEYGLKIAEELGLSRQDREGIYLSGLLHDIGKIGVPQHILTKAGRLTNDEINTTRLHSLRGAEILEGIKPLKDVIPAIRHHHEHFDGRGYPYGLKGDQIPLFARILALADAYDAMTSDRPYRSRIPEEKAVREIIENKGKQFDPEIVDVFLRARQKENWAKGSKATVPGVHVGQGFSPA